MNTNVKKMTFAALFAAVIFVATAYLPRIPIGGLGYVHLGDAFIYIAACFLPLPYAPVAAGIGGALADLVTGYAFYMPFTFVVKLCLALVFTCKKDTIINKKNLLATLICVPITYFGYLIPDAILSASIATAAYYGLMNILQAVGSAVIFIIIGKVLDKVNFKKRI